MDATAYDFWLLDLDGTIVDVEFDYIRSVFDRVGRIAGYEFSDEQARAIWYGRGGSRDRLLRELGLDSDRFWEIFHQVEDPTARVAASFRYDDAAFVGELAVPVGLVTHCQSYLARPVIEYLDMTDWFDAVVCCTGAIGWKPDPAPIERAMADLGVATVSHDGVLLGDSPHDVAAARNAGLDAVHVERHDPSVRSRPVDADAQVTCLDELAGSASSMATDGTCGADPQSL